jgi:hypothetical protein
MKHKEAKEKHDNMAEGDKRRIDLTEVHIRHNKNDALAESCIPLCSFQEIYDQK